MMLKERLNALAAKHGIHAFQEEQRFRLALLLYNLREYEMVFKGGTMIWFVFNNLRYSRDLDFNLDSESKRPSKNALQKTVKRASGSADYLKEFRESETFINAEVSFPGMSIPLGIKIKIEITVPYQYIDRPELKFFSFGEYGLPSFSHRVLSTESVLADKVNGLQKRKKPFNVLKDAFDIWCLTSINNRSTTKEHIVNIFKKTSIKPDKQKIVKRLDKCLGCEKQFRQYLLPSAKLDLEEIVENVKDYVEGIL